MEKYIGQRRTGSRDLIRWGLIEEREGSGGSVENVCTGRGDSHNDP